MVRSVKISPKRKVSPKRKNMRSPNISIENLSMDIKLFENSVDNLEKVGFKIITSDRKKGYYMENSDFIKVMRMTEKYKNKIENSENLLMKNVDLNLEFNNTKMKLYAIRERLAKEHMRLNCGAIARARGINRERKGC